MSSTPVLYVGNDNLLEVDELRDAASDAYLTAATVTVTLTDRAGAQIAGVTWPLTMTLAGAGNARYQVTLPDSLSLVPGSKAIAIIDADAGAGRNGHWELECDVEVRKS